MIFQYRNIKVLKMFRLTLYCFLFFYITAPVTSVIKYWKPTINFNDTSNWEDKKLPCEADRIILPATLQAAITLPIGKISFRELILPREGEIIFTNQAIYLTGEQKTVTCMGKDKFFKRIKISPWLQPDNWRSANSDKPVPDLEQIPCEHDDVIFPPYSTVYVLLPEKQCTIRSLTVDGTEMSDLDFKRYLLSESGTRQFINENYVYDIITIQDVDCPDCVCHPRSDESLEKAVCQYVQCQRPRCLSPIKPVGFCCQICGASLLSKFDSSKFSSNSLKTFIKDQTDNSRYELNFYSSKVLYKDGVYTQIIITEKNDYQEESTKFANDLKEKLDSTSNLGLKGSFILMQSGYPYDPDSGIGFFTIFFSTLAVVIVCIIIMFVYFEPLQERKIAFTMPSIRIPTLQPFLFARFENAPDGGLEFGSRSAASSVFNLNRASFDNPLCNIAGPSNLSIETGESDISEQVETNNSLKFSELKDKDSDQEDG